MFTYLVNRNVLLCCRWDTASRGAVIVGAFTWLTLQQVIVIHHDLFSFYTDQTSELSEATLVASFKSFRVVLIPAIPPGCIINLLS